MIDGSLAAALWGPRLSPGPLEKPGIQEKSEEPAEGWL